MKLVESYYIDGLTKGEHDALKRVRTKLVYAGTRQASITLEPFEASLLIKMENAYRNHICKMQKQIDGFVEDTINDLKDKGIINDQDKGEAS